MHAVIHKIGVTPEVQDVAKKTVVATLRVMGNSPKLSSVLKRIGQEQEKYISGHSLALAEIACALACKMDWRSPGTFLKLSLAAFLHDLPLTDDSLAQIQTLSELEARKGLSAQQIHAFKFHPIEAAEFSKKFREIPPDVDAIILGHHETPDGKGFPRGLLHHQLSPLAALFIIAHDLLNFFLSQEKYSTMIGYLSTRAERYTQGNFKKIFLTIQRDYISRSK